VRSFLDPDQLRDASRRPVLPFPPCFIREAGRRMYDDDPQTYANRVQIGFAHRHGGELP